jgi:hypothetical protein
MHRSMRRPEAVLAEGLGAGDEDHFAGRSDDELRALIAEADASGPAVPWDSAAGDASRASCRSSADRASPKI